MAGEHACRQFHAKAGEALGARYLSRSRPHFLHDGSTVRVLSRHLWWRHEIIPHCVSSGADDLAPRPARTRSRDKETQILYTGNINAAMNQDALGILPAALIRCRRTTESRCSPARRRLGAKRRGLATRGFTWGGPAWLKRVRGSAKPIYSFCRFPSRIVAPEVKTVFATKTLDYLTAGVPIVVYGPADCHHCCMRKSNGWGYVVRRGQSSGVDAGGPRSGAIPIFAISSSPELLQKRGAATRFAGRNVCKKWWNRPGALQLQNRVAKRGVGDRESGETAERLRLRTHTFRAK